MPLYGALNVKYRPFGEAAVAISLHLKSCVSDVGRELNDVYPIQLHTHVRAPLSPGTPFPPISPESGPSLLTERITTAKRERGRWRERGVIRGGEGLAERKREAACVAQSAVANRRPRGLALKLHFLSANTTSLQPGGGARACARMYGVTLHSFGLCM